MDGSGGFQHAPTVPRELPRKLKELLAIATDVYIDDPALTGQKTLPKIVIEMDPKKGIRLKPETTQLYKQVLMDDAEERGLGMCDGAEFIRGNGSKHEYPRMELAFPESADHKSWAADIVGCYSAHMGAHKVTQR